MESTFKKGLICSVLVLLLISVFSASFPIYAQTSVAIQGATVSVSGDNGRGYATTDASGHYTVNSGLPTGTYDVTVMIDGYIINQTKGINITSGQTFTLNVFLFKSGAVSGRVTDSNGNPVANTYVFVSPNDVTSNYGYYATTDSNGYFNVYTNLGTGSYNITAGYTAHGLVPAIKANVMITAGQQTSNVNLVLQTSGKITGKVTFPNGSAAANANVYAVGNGYFGSATSASDGTYTIDTGLGSGNYSVFAVTSNFFNQVSNVSVIAGQTTSGVNVQLQQLPYPPVSGLTGRITGKVTDKTTGNPISGATVQASGPAGSATNSTDSSGNYVLESNLGNGTYTVNASAYGYAPQSISGVSVNVGKTTSGVNFQLQPVPPAQSGTLTGTVTGEPNPVPEFPSGLTIPLLLAIVVLGTFLSYVRIRNGKLSTKGTKSMKQQADALFSLTN